MKINTPQKAVIVIEDHERIKTKEIKAYVIDRSPLFLLIHKTENPNYKKWVISDAKTGLQVSDDDYNTLREAKAAITPDFLQACSKQLAKDVFNPYKALIKKAYMKINPPKRWEFFPEDW